VVRAAGVRVKTNGHYTATNLAVHPITSGAGVSPESPLFLVILEQSTAPNPDPPTSVPDASPETDAAASDARIVALRQELLAKEESLQRAIEELESSTEELKSSNEEMQSVNEELQSTNEELETSKEELQSVNEELATVNAELQAKVLDLSRSNNDMNNLLAGTGVGTVFVDHQLRVMRFTPAASQVINLIQSDVGRPVTHIVSNLVGYDRLADDLRSVLDTLVPKEMTVQTTDGKWYTMRVQPYRTMDNVIEGAVVSFVDVSEIVQARESLRKANENLSRLAIVVRDAHDAITVQDLEGRVRAWNPAAERMYGWTEAEALALDSHARIPSALQGEAITKMRQLCDAERLEPFRTQRLTRNGEVVDVWVTVTPLVDESGQTYAIATTERLCPVVSMNS
jgi:two-component system CheB/CheR fusion protein